MTIVPYLEISALLSHYQKSFLRRQMGPISREWETLELSALNGMSPSNSPTQGSEKYV